MTPQQIRRILYGRRPRHSRWNYNYIPEEIVQQSVIPEEVSTTPWAATIMDALVNISTIIILVYFYAVDAVDAVLSYGSTVVWYDVKYSYRVAWYAVKNVRKGIVKSKVVKNVVVTKEVDTKPTPMINVKPTSTIDAKPTPPELVQIPVVNTPTEFVLEVTVKPTEAIQIPVPEVKPMPKPTPPELVQIPVKPKVVPKPTPITSLKTENKQENRQNNFFYPNWQKLYQSCNSFNLLFQSTLTNCNFSHNFKSRYKLISYGKPQLSLNPYKKGSYIRVDFQTFQCRAIHPAPRGKTHHGSWTSQLPHPHLHTGDHKQQAKPTNRQTHRYTET